MNPQQRIVTRQPMTELWRDDGFTTSERGGSLASDELAALLAAGPVCLVVSSVGEPLEWIAPEFRFDFWKREVKAHLAEPSARAGLDDFPDGYCYFASLWQGDALPIVLLEKHH